MLRITALRVMYFAKLMVALMETLRHFPGRFKKVLVQKAVESLQKDSDGHQAEIGLLPHFRK